MITTVFYRVMLCLDASWSKSQFNAQYSNVQVTKTSKSELIYAIVI